MKRSKVRIRAFAAAMLMIVATVMTPIEAFADTEDYERYEEALNIDTSQVDVKDTWRQIRNAALFHLIAAKLEYCIYEKNLPAVGTLDEFAFEVKGGKYFWHTPTILGAEVNSVNTGAWLEAQLASKNVLDVFLHGSNGDVNGAISCTSANMDKLMDMFVNIYTVYEKNAKAELTLSNVANVGSVTTADRMRVICDPDDQSKAGLLIGKDISGNIVSCNNASKYSDSFDAEINSDLTSQETIKYLVSIIDGNSVKPREYQIAYLMRLYNKIKEYSGNTYMPDWTTPGGLNTYTGVDAYYLYSLDFHTLGCAQSGRDYRVWTIDNDTGKVEYKSYGINKSKAANSFAGELALTCQQIGERMNKYAEEYLKIVNFEVYNVCKTAIDEKILEKTTEINEKYINNGDATDEAKDLAQEVLDIYADVQKTGAYVAKMEEDGKTGTEVIKVKGENGAISDTVGNMPTDMVFTCRASLPFIGVNITPEINWEEGLSGFGGDGNAACKEGSGALGWILCPVLTAVAGIGDTMWNQIEEKYMEVPATEIFRGDGGVDKAWGSIRDMANVIFVILLLVVIFSQLTGVGIDNYGVKRILPRLILVAVLVNLSWVICELAVDLSNIVGNGLETMFNNMGQTIMSGATVTENLSVVSQGVAWTADILVAGGATYLFAFLGAGAPLAALAAIGVAALGIVITVVVALLTLYLILIAREAGIVIAIVLAPAAIVCWALPNTEKIFKRWLDLAKALLLVYPICGALVGGGYLASAVLLNIPNMALAAGIVQVLPYFFIPMILKNSLSALGNIGARISTLGRSLGRRGSGAVRGAIGNSERYKDFQQYQREQGQARRAQRVFNRLNGRTNLSQREQDRLRKAQDVLLAQKRKTDENALRTGGDYYKAAERQQELSLAEENAKVERMVGAGYDAAKISQEKAIDKGRTEDYMALINDRTRNGANEDELNKMFEDYMKSGNKYGAIAAARIAGRRKDTAARFAEKHFGAGGDINNYSENMMRSLSKEMAEGESSAMYKAASPLQFAYASKLNEGSALGQTYEQWASSTENVDNAMSAFVTKSDELISVKKKGLSEIAELMGTDEKPGVMSEKERTRLQTLARETISNRSRIAGWDSTKADEIAKIAGWTYKDGVFRDKTGNVVGGSTEMNIPHGAGGTGGAGDSGSGPAPETFEGGGGI